MISFQAWPKTQRLSNTNVTVTEKLDGTNGAVIIESLGVTPPTFWPRDNAATYVTLDGQSYAVAAQSRKRLITPRDDNYGFAEWVWSHASDLVDLLRPGRHFGEWWGQGIQRRYDMHQKVFSLFNTHRWAGDRWALWTDIGMDVVPVLYEGPLEHLLVNECVETLRVNGSAATLPWGIQFDRPEGVVTHFHYTDFRLKSFLENDDTPKGEV